jgi:hypothetical protein
LTIDEEQLKRNLEIWENINSLKSNFDRFLHHDLLSEEKIEESRNEYIKSFNVKPWEFKIGVEYSDCVDPRKIIGTAHPDYQNIYLYDVIKSLKRGPGVIYNYIISPDYYIDEDLRETNEKKLFLSYKKHEDKYYISGDGNHRFFLSKILELDKVIVNEVYIYDEDVELRFLLQELNRLGFGYKIDKQSIKIKSAFVYIELDGQIKDKLEYFIDCYNKLSLSLLREKYYKVRVLFSYNYRQKFSYSNDTIKHIFHFNYLSLIEHKRNNHI